MAGLPADRPSEVVLAARVARQFYLEGVSKVDIADRMGISRFRVPGCSTPPGTIAVVAIGARAPAMSAIYDAVTPAECDALAALGVYAELAGVFIGEGGRPLPTPLDSRVIMTSGPALQRIPFVLCVAYGVAKSPAVFAAIRGGLVHGLVIHASLARALLSLASKRVGGP